MSVQSIIESLTGKTILGVGVSPRDYRPGGMVEDDNYADEWTIRFTDGTSITLSASYDDSSVHINEITS